MANPLAAPTKSKRLIKFPFPFAGLNSTAPSLVLSKVHCPRVDGIRFSQGQLSSEPKLVSLSGLGATPLNGAFTQYRADGSILSYAALTNTFAVYNNDSATWIITVFGSGAFGTDEDHWSFTDVFGEVFASNGAGMLVSTLDGGLFEDLGSAASPFNYSGRFLTTFGGRLVLANTREGPIQHEERVRWSSPDDPRDFTTLAISGAIDLVDLPGPITGTVVMGGRQFIHKRTGIIAMLETGLLTPPFAFQTVVDNIGTIAGHTLCCIRGIQFFLGADDVYMYDGASAPTPIGEPIRKELFATLNWAKLGNCWALDYPTFHEYHLFVATGSDQWPKVDYIYDYIERTWTKRTLATALTAGALYQPIPLSDTWDGGVDETWDAGSDVPWDTPAEGNLLMPFYGRADGLVSTPDESQITLGVTNFIETGDWDLDRPGDFKTVSRVRVTARQRNDATLSLSLSVDGGGTFTAPVTIAVGAPVGDENSIRTLFFPVVPTTGEFFRIKLSSSDRFSLVSWEFEVIDRAEVK